MERFRREQPAAAAPSALRRVRRRRTRVLSRRGAAWLPAGCIREPQGPSFRFRPV